MAAVAPLPTKSTSSVGPQLTARLITRRASSRSSVITRPVDEMVVCEFA